MTTGETEQARRIGAQCKGLWGHACMFGVSRDDGDTADLRSMAAILAASEGGASRHRRCSRRHMHMQGRAAGLG